MIKRQNADVRLGQPIREISPIIGKTLAFITINLLLLLVKYF